MKTTKPLLPLNPALTVNESLYALLSYEAGIEIDENDLTLESIKVFDNEEEGDEFNTILVLKVNPTTEKFKHSEENIEKKIVRHDIKDYVEKKSVSLEFEDDLTLYKDGYTLAKINSVLGTNFTEDQVIIDFPGLTRIYTPDELTINFNIIKNKDIRFYGDLVFKIKDSVDRRPDLNEVFTTDLLSGFALPE